MNIAIYARVSSESQAKDGTIQSQLEVLREYAISENHHVIAECIDDGYSGTDLVRPGLDRLRDLATDKKINAILALSPDRLARKYAHQVVLLEELEKNNINALFTNRQIGDSPEDNLMLQMQGVFAEYERTKILERSRRGKLYAARRGQLNGGNAPYGYTVVKKTNTTPTGFGG